MAIPLIFGGIKLGAFVAWLGTEKDDTFVSSDIVQYYLCTDTDFKNETSLKQHITGIINKIILPKHNFFKIGKSSSVEARASNHKCKKYKKMYLLIRSTDKTIINRLETYYNNHYINHQKNDNKRVGSAGEMSSVDNYYYLYIVVR